MNQGIGDHDGHSLIIVWEDKARCKSLEQDIAELGYTVVESSLAGLPEAVRTAQPMGIIIDPFINDGEGLKAVTTLESTPLRERPYVLLLLPARPELPDFINQLDMSMTGVLTYPYAKDELRAQLSHIAQKRVNSFRIAPD